MMWLGYTRAGKELEVVWELDEKNITAYCARKVEAKRVGKRRRPDVFIEPVLTNYIFIECTDEQYLDVIATKHLYSTMTAIPLADQAQVMRFVQQAEKEFNTRMAKIEAGERLDEFRSGDLLKVLDGPLTGLTARFRGIVERDHDIFPAISADVEMMGQTVRVELDPITVKAAE